MLKIRVCDIYFFFSQNPLYDSHGTIISKRYQSSPSAYIKEPILRKSRVDNI